MRDPPSGRRSGQLMSHDAAERPERSLPLVVGQSQPELAQWGCASSTRSARGGRIGLMVVA